MTETLEQLRQDRDAYKQAYENMCVFYKQLVAANQRLAASHEAVEHSVQADLLQKCANCGEEKKLVVCQPCLNELVASR